MNNKDRVEDYSEDISALEAEVEFLSGMEDSYLLETHHYETVLDDNDSGLHNLAVMRARLYGMKRERVQGYLDYLKGL